MLLCGYEPFYGEGNAELLHANRTVDYEFHSPDWDDISSEAKDWIAKALAPSADERLQIEEARRHPWLRSLTTSSKSNISFIPQQPTRPEGAPSMEQLHCSVS